MDAKRQGEIARVLFKDMLSTEGPEITPDMLQKIESKVIKIGIRIPVRESMEFVKIILRELFEEALAKPESLQPQGMR